MSNHVHAQLFQMIPLSNEGHPMDTDTDHHYGFEVHSDDAEFSDYGLTLDDARSRLQPDTLLALLAERDYDLAVWAARKGAYINGNYYSPCQLARCDLTLPDPEGDE